MSSPLISVMIPTYNREKYIKEAIDSVIDQDYRPLEIIVVDDGSTDGTGEICKQYDPDIVKYYYQKKMGQPTARNACVAHSSGEFLAWLDSDDLYLPGKLSAQIQYLSNHPECEIIFTRAEDFLDGEASPDVMEQVRDTGGLVSRQKVYHATMLARRDMIFRVGLRDESLPVHDDGEWLTRIGTLHHVDLTHCLDTVYLRRRIHAGCISVTRKTWESISQLHNINAKNLRKHIRGLR